MLVAKYPNWVAIVEDRKNGFLFFDGAKDFFKYLFDVSKYRPGRRAEHISRMLVTEFYGLTRIDARKAFFVTGSDVLGPMGHELIPLASREDAKEFLADHKGRRILVFDEVTRDLVAKLDAGRPD
jgi:nitrous oxide reductase accessory protein NosL